MIKANEIRKKFLNFFASKGHTVVESDSLVPKDDPTVLFTTAGMQQFKRQFLGHIDDYTRATTSQKCLRTDDLDQVGKTNFHHTFFEMLGNFSFGDYFKKDAIIWAWEFLTKELQLPKEKLWVSVYKDDPEAEEIWKTQVKDLDPKKIVLLGDHDNFWPADAKKNGPNGPCGPCSEIFYDLGPQAGRLGDQGNPGTDPKRFSEIWNLVFTQFNRKDGGILEPLPNKNIDTGMGLERLTAVVQGKQNNFETDLFTPIVDAINAYVDKNHQTTKEKRCIMADHIRAIAFGINDGVVPSNEGRGYVIKKLIIDTTDIAIQAGNTYPVVHKLVDSVIETMKEAYPDIAARAQDIKDVVENIEGSYFKARKERLPEFEKETGGASSAEELGEIIFKFRDTYGLAINTLEDSLNSIKEKKEWLPQAWEKFSKLMKQQQDQSRAASKMTGDVFTNISIDLNVPKTDFLGYDHCATNSTILKLMVNNRQTHEVKKGDQISLILDKTPFYAESGGQIADTGLLTKDANQIRVTDTQKMDGVFIHYGIVETGSFKIQDAVKASIDADRRKAIMRNHTATHLLQSVLRTVLGQHIKQQGSLVAEGRLRFDFSHPKGITSQELSRIERFINEMILANTPVTTEYLDVDEARNSGALAFFAEKYGKIVRVVTIGDYSKEFCGGTHLDATGEIGLFKIAGESAIAQGIRRIEARTGLGALEFIDQDMLQLNRVCDLLKTTKTDILERVNHQNECIKNFEKEIEKYRLEAIKGSIDSIIKEAQNINGSQIISHTFENIEMGILRKTSDLIRQKAKSAVIVLGARSQDNASLLVCVSEDLIQKGIKADEIINNIAPLINGNGGGRPQMAQAGSKQAAKIDQAIEQANRLIRGMIQS